MRAVRWRQTATWCIARCAVSACRAPSRLPSPARAAARPVREAGAGAGAGQVGVAAADHQPLHLHPALAGSRPGGGPFVGMLEDHVLGVKAATKQSDHLVLSL